MIKILLTLIVSRIFRVLSILCKLQRLSTASSLAVLQKLHIQWTAAGNLQQSTSTVSPGSLAAASPHSSESRPFKPSIPLDAGGRFHTRSAEELDTYLFANARAALDCIAGTCYFTSADVHD